MQYVAHAARAWRYYQPAHAKLGVTQRKIAVEFAFRRDAHFKLVKGTATCLECVAQASDTLCGGVEVKRVAEPSVAKPRRAAERMRRFAAENNFGIRLLDWTRFRAHSAERKEPAAEFRLFHQPQRLHRGEYFFRTPALVVERHSDRLEFELEVADPDSEDQASTGNHVDRRKLFGEHDRVSKRQDDDSRAKPDCARMRRDERYRDREIDEDCMWRHRRRRHLRVSKGDIDR